MKGGGGEGRGPTWERTVAKQGKGPGVPPPFVTDITTPDAAKCFPF